MVRADPAVLVTGGARRLGAAIVTALHAVGSRVAIHCRHSREAAQVLAQRLNAIRPDSACVVQADLLDTAGIPNLIDEVVARFGALDGLVNNASDFYPTPLGEMTEQDWHTLIGSNLRAPLFLSQAAAGQLVAQRGAIVNLVDIHAERPLAGYPMYSVAKAGLAGLTRSLAIELAPHVRANGIAPGPIEWPEHGQISPAEQARILAHTPLQRTGTAAEIAAAVRFLLLEATYVTGQILAVDGGRSIRL